MPSVGLPDDMEAHEKILSDEYGPHCGLNADWSVTAWLAMRLVGDRPNRGVGLYVIDDEDHDCLVVCLRNFEDEAGEIVDLFSAPYSRVAEVLTKVATLRRILNPCRRP